MSPEQATGDQHVGPASDIYAVGCVLYEMLVGDPPYTGSTAQAVLGKILSGDPVAPAEHRPSVPANVDGAIRRALQSLPADRFATADELARALGDPAFRYGAGSDGDGHPPAVHREPRWPFVRVGHRRPPEQELCIYDLRTGAFQTLERANYVGTPVWSPDGRHVVFARFPTPESDAIASLEIDSNAGSKDLLSGDPYLYMVPTTYLADDSLLVGQTSGSGSAEMIDLTSSPPTVEPIGVDAFFVEISPDRRWIAYQNQSTPGIQLQPWPDLDRRYLIDPSGQDPQWASSTELVYWAFLSDTATVSSGAGLYSVTIDPARDPPFEGPESIVSDAHFADTPGQSFEIMPDGDVVYKRSPTESLGYYVRVIPGFVEDMKRRVDDANR
jgi:serine/threonine protein kinase